MATQQGFPVEEACLVVELRYGLRIDKATAKSLPSYEDANVLVKTLDNQEFVLKIANPDELEESLRFQNAAMEWLSVQGCRSPKVIKTIDGEGLFRLEEGRVGARRLVRLLEYLPGVPYATVAPHNEVKKRNLD